MLRVIKVGGSLLDWPELAPALRAWLQCQPLASNLLIAGGGTLVEALRELDRVHGLSEAVAHDLAVRAMSITARFLSAILPEPVLVSDLPDAATAESHSIAVLDPVELLALSAAQKVLPRSWDTTSDSIAAWIASRAAASELVVLKSCLPSGHTPAAWSAEGYVDRHFPAAASGLSVIRCINLRERDFAEVSCTTR